MPWIPVGSLLLKSKILQKRPIMSFVKLDRSLRENPYAGDPDHLALWIWLLMLAAFKKHPVILNKCHISLKPGDLVTSLRILSSRSGISKDRVNVILSHFEEAGMIQRRSNNKYTHISLVNWDKYQRSQTPARHGTDRREECKRSKAGPGDEKSTDQALLEMDCARAGRRDGSD